MIEQASGLLMVLTGNGKGKTTSAIGQAIRAAGNGMKVCFIQFIKGGDWKSGERQVMERLADLVEFRVMGRGFTWKSDDPEKDRALASEAWAFATDAITSGQYRMVVLDEFTYAFNYGMVDQDEVLEVLENRPPGVHIVITGRDAPPELVDIADLVTEMCEVKHPYKKRIKAQRGIEF